MNRLALLAVAVLVAGCGAQEPASRGPQPGPYSQDATAECVEEAGYDFEMGHGDPPSMRAEDIVFMIWFEDLGETWIDFYHPSAEIPSEIEGVRYDNAVVVLDTGLSQDHRDAVVGCLR